MPSHPDVERASRRALRTRLEQDRRVHIYGLGDLTDAYWSRSRWWERGSATIGEIGLPGDPPDLIVYGVNAGDPQLALDLWVDVDHLLPDRYFATGPVGFARHLATHGRIVEFDAGEHVKMFCENLSPNHQIAPELDGLTSRSINRDDLPAIEQLLATRIAPGSVFSPTLLDDGPFHGVFTDDRLIAIAGVHVCSQEIGVAAVGCVLVHPEHRGLGLGSVVTAAVVRALVELGINDIGLNVKADNTVARSIYERLGFVEVHRYEEALLARPPETSTPGARPHCF